MRARGSRVRLPRISRSVGLRHHHPTLDGLADPVAFARKGGVQAQEVPSGGVLGWLAAGMSETEILADYPELELADIRACLAFAAEREHQVVRLAA